MNYSKVFTVFAKNYKEIPLEIFANDPYKALVSTLLSARTRDETTLKVCKELFKIAPNIKFLNKLSQLEIRDLIYPVGFYNTKAIHLKQLAQLLIEKYNGKVPNNYKDLVTLPGVGRKTANLVLNRAFSIPAIAVDTHVHRISNLLGWVNTKNPKETEIELQKILPEKYWSKVNRLFVSIGQQYRSQNKLVAFLQSNNLFVKEQYS